MRVGASARTLSILLFTFGKYGPDKKRKTIAIIHLNMC